MNNKEKEKEAIKALKWLVEHAKEEGLNHVDCVSVEALDVVIKALEERISIIDNAPTVELQMGRMTNGIVIPIERQQGEWIRHISCIECSVCKEKFFSADEDENCQDYDACSDYDFNYCPNCGAKMGRSA